MNGLLTRARKFNDQISTNPGEVIARSENRGAYLKHKGRKIGLAVLGLMVFNTITDGGVTSVFSSADKGAQTFLYGHDTDHKGVVGSTVSGIGSWIEDKIPHISIGGDDSNSTPAQEVPAVTVAGALPACPTEVVTVTRRPNEYVSTAVYELNDSFVPLLGDVKELDDLWANYFEQDNPGQIANNPETLDSNLRLLTSIDNCEIR